MAELFRGQQMKSNPSVDAKIQQINSNQSVDENILCYNHAIRPASFQSNKFQYYSCYGLLLFRPLASLR
jgi:hypothetical protein